MLLGKRFICVLHLSVAFGFLSEQSAAAPLRSNAAQCREVCIEGHKIPLSGHEDKLRVIRIGHKEENKVDELAFVVAGDLERSPIDALLLRRLKDRFVDVVARIAVPPDLKKSFSYGNPEVLRVKISGMNRESFLGFLTNTVDLTAGLGQVDLAENFLGLLETAAPQTAMRMKDLMFESHGYTLMGHYSASIALDLPGFQSHVFSQSLLDGRLAGSTGSFNLNSSIAGTRMAQLSFNPKGQWSALDRLLGGIFKGFERGAEVGGVGAAAGATVGAAGGPLGAGAGALAGGVMGASVGGVLGIMEGISNPASAKVSPSGVEVTHETTTVIDEKANTKSTTTTTTAKDLESGEVTVEKTVIVKDLTENDDKSCVGGCEGSGESTTTEGNKHPGIGEVGEGGAVPLSLDILEIFLYLRMTQEEPLSAIKQLDPRVDPNINWGIDGKPVRSDGSRVRAPRIDPLKDPKPELLYDSMGGSKFEIINPLKDPTYVFRSR